jgi:hypothetical protein
MFHVVLHIYAISLSLKYDPYSHRRNSRRDVHDLAWPPQHPYTAMTETGVDQPWT